MICKEWQKEGLNGTCKFGFPYSPRIEPNSCFNIKQTNGNITNHDMKIKMMCHFNLIIFKHVSLI
jgi:hypothetical protein